MAYKLSVDNSSNSFFSSDVVFNDFKSNSDQNYISGNLYSVVASFILLLTLPRF